jgi:hypothetical protein
MVESRVAAAEEDSRKTIRIRRETGQVKTMGMSAMNDLTELEPIPATTTMKSRDADRGCARFDCGPGALEVGLGGSGEVVGRHLVLSADMTPEVTAQLGA